MRRTSNFLVHVALLVVCAIEAVNGYWLLTTADKRVWLFLFHLLLVAVFLFFLRSLQETRLPVKNNLIPVAGFLATVLPVYGMLGMILTYHFIQRSKTQPREYFELDQEFLPGEHKNWIKDAEQHMLQIKRDQLAIDSFRDVFESEDPYVEEMVISKLSRSLEKESVEILKEVAKSSRSDSKVLAASALIEMEDRVIERIEILRSRLRETGEWQEPDLLLDLARAYDLYCYLGVLDSTVEKHYRELALEQYNKFLKQRPEHGRAMLEYGRLLLNSGQIERAQEVLNRALQFGHDPMNVRIWLAEAHFKTKHFATVRKICSELRDSEELPDAMKEVVENWTHPEAA